MCFNDLEGGCGVWQTGEYFENPMPLEGGGAAAFTCGTLVNTTIVRRA